MLLSRLFLNPMSREVHAYVNDSQRLHALMAAMCSPPGEPITQGPSASGERILYRLEASEEQGTMTLLIQSPRKPEQAFLPPYFLDPRAGNDAFSTTSLAPFLERVVPGSRFRFRLRCNPARKIDTKTQEDGKRRNGRRVPLRTDPERLAWLKRHFEAIGVRLLSQGDESGCRQMPEAPSQGLRQGRVLRHDAYLFEGVLEIEDAEKARAGILAGIGPAKGYGFGLLSLAPLM